MRSGHPMSVEHPMKYGQAFMTRRIFYVGMAAGALGRRCRFTSFTHQRCATGGEKVRPNGAKSRDCEVEAGRTPEFDLHDIPTAPSRRRTLSRRCSGTTIPNRGG